MPAQKGTRGASPIDSLSHNVIAVSEGCGERPITQLPPILSSTIPNWMSWPYLFGS
jgi:hypothetical protein